MLHHRLDAGQRALWQEQGFLHLPGILAPPEVRQVLSVVDELIPVHERSHPGDVARATYAIPRALERSPELHRLMDHPRLFPAILDLMGPYLQIMGSEIYVRSPRSEPVIHWHVDNGPSYRQIRLRPDSLALTLKVQFYLTDIPAEHRANFWVVPGSHRRDFPGREAFPDGAPEGAIQLLARAGDCTIFENTVWHAVSANRGDTVRRSVTLRYGQMWCRPYDYDRAPASVLAEMTPRQRRLMGELGPTAGPADYFRPTDQVRVIMDGFEFECPHV